MPMTISQLLNNRRKGSEILEAGRLFCKNLAEEPQNTIFGFMLELFNVEEEQHEMCIEIQRKLGIKVDDQKYTAIVFKHLPGGGRTPVTVDLAVGRKMAQKKLYQRFNDLHGKVEQDCLGEDDFFETLARNSAVEAKIELDPQGEYDEETTALAGQYDFVLYNVTSSVATIHRFEQEETKKKKGKKPRFEDEEEEPDDDEESSEIDDWPEDDDSELDNG